MENSSENILNVNLKDVNIDLMLQVVSEESISDIVKSSVTGTSYTRTKRLSVSQLCERFASNVKEAQTSYSASINAAVDDLKLNLKMCERMDLYFGSEYNDETEESFQVIKSKDGSRLLRCPLQNCSTKTFKLRRHLRDVHSTLSDEGQNLAVEISQKFERNKAIAANGADDSADEKKKSKKHKTLNLVARKDNYKTCAICENLYLNLPDHVVKFHNISRTDSNYDRYVRDPVTIPRCYTKSLNGKIVALTGDELEEAKKEFEEIVETQENELQTRKRLRDEIIRITQKISTNHSEEELVVLNKELCALKVKYNKNRYPDSRVYTENVEKWKDCYIDYLKKQTSVDPQRLQRMAMDVFLDYEKQSEKSLTFSDISKPITVKNILGNFRESKKISFLSKLKYVGQFSHFMDYLLISIDSPEVSGKESQQEMAARQFKYEQIKSEIKKELAILNKMKGKDLIHKNKKAKGKLVSEEEMQNLLTKTESYLKEVHEAMLDGSHLHYSRKEVTKVRDSLIAVATVRLGRRSLEMTRMTLNEVKEATESLINDEKYYTINVAEQKNTHTGKPAPVVYNEIEYSVLIRFIDDLRRQITTDDKCVFVFPAYPKLNSKQNQLLGLSAAFKILQKFQTESGKKISSRTIRGSKVTNSRQQNCSEEHLNHLANSMSHSRSTADGYYDFSSVNNSIAHVLGSDSSNKVCSTPNKSANLSEKSLSNSEKSPNVSSILSLPSSPVPSTSGIIRKRKVTFDTSSDSDIDHTLIELRTKKVKSSSPNVKMLEEEVIKILKVLKEKNLTGSMVSRNGTVSVKLVSKELPSDLKSVSTKILRSLVKKHLQ